MRSIATFALFVVPIAVSAQVLVGSVDVGGVQKKQQRLTLSCPYFDSQTGWVAEKSIYTLHILDVSERADGIAPDLHGIYSHHAKRWATFESIDTNRIVFSIRDIDQKKEYVADGRTRGGRMVSKGENAAREERVCARSTQYLDRNTLELKFELDDPIPPPSVAGGILTTCVGADAFPRGETLVKSQCEIVPYRPAPNRIGF